MTPIVLTTFTEPTLDQCEALAKVFQIGMTGNSKDWKVLDIDGKNAYPTPDKLEYHDGSHWLEASGREDIEVNDYKGIFWETVQSVYGTPRYSLAVIDCGDYRLFFNNQPVR